MAEDASCYIVRTKNPTGDAKSHYLGILTEILGRGLEAKKSLACVYQHANTGFAAYLTKEQANRLSNHPDVLQVYLSRTLPQGS